jgi:hypothetical protein
MEPEGELRLTSEAPGLSIWSVQRNPSAYSIPDVMGWDILSRSRKLETMEPSGAALAAVAVRIIASSNRDSVTSISVTLLRKRRKNRWTRY